MIRAIVKNGGIKALDPLPRTWRDGYRRLEHGTIDCLMELGRHDRSPRPTWPIAAGEHPSAVAKHDEPARILFALVQ